MVYGGKPSTGCYLCRKRKIKVRNYPQYEIEPLLGFVMIVYITFRLPWVYHRLTLSTQCDEGRPGCRNCSIYGRPCPGYRPDAVFRNETSKVERLAKKENSSSSSSQSQTPPSHSSAVVNRRHRDPSEDLTLTLHRIADSTWEERAVCYFFDQYTVNADQEEGMGHLEYLPPLYARAGEISHRGAGSPAACLRRAVDATALMTLANASNAPQLMIKARQGYGKALRGLREALSSPDSAVKDETFASVMLLSLFEDITGERNGLLSSHTAGFEFLMKLRGKSQLDHQRGRDMFNFAYAHTVCSINPESLSLGLCADACCSMLKFLH